MTASTTRTTAVGSSAPPSVSTGFPAGRVGGVAGAVDLGVVPRLGVQPVVEVAEPTGGRRPRPRIRRRRGASSGSCPCHVGPVGEPSPSEPERRRRPRRRSRPSRRGRRRGRDVHARPRSAGHHPGGGDPIIPGGPEVVAVPAGEPSFAVPVADPHRRRARTPTCSRARPTPPPRPLSAARLRSSFQLLRAQSSETGGSETEGLELLRPGDEVTEIFVTGTLINANLQEAACLANLEVPFDFPRVVVARSGDAFTARPEDFVVRCFYVGVRSREASAAPGASSPAAGTSTPPPPRSCEDTVTLAMTDAGPVMAFKDDVVLCPGCWLVGGRDGVLFSWRHRDGLRLRVAAGDEVGDGAARCKPVA